MRFMFLFLTTLAWAQNTRITLYVEDLKGAPLAGISISPKPGSAEAPTDSFCP